MKGHIVNTPFYTKVNWCDESIFLSMYGQHKSYGEPRSIEYQSTTSAGRAMHSKYGVNGKASFNGKVIGKNALELESDLTMHQNFGWEQKNAQEREQKHARAGARLSSVDITSGKFRVDFA